MFFLVTMYQYRHFIYWTHQHPSYLLYFEQYFRFVTGKKEDAGASELDDYAGASSLENNIMRMALSNLFPQIKKY